MQLVFQALHHYTEIMKRGGRLAVAGLLALLGGGQGVAALELVPGGYGAHGPAPGETDVPLDVGGSTTATGIALEFTPRGALPARGAADESGVRFDLTVRGGGGPDALDRFGLGTSRDALRAGNTTTSSALTVGGAMRWSDWSIGGGLGRAEVLGESYGVLSAILGYGALTAEIGLGQGEPATGAPEDVLMLRTDLAAWSWLTLESDLAVGAVPSTADRDRDRAREPVASGRFGIRLNF